jgi:hypothetical protein
MRQFATAVLITLASPAFAAESPLLIDVPALAHASQAQVEQVLGKAEFCRKSRYGLSCRFAAHGVEVVFANDKAERITVNDMGDTPYDKNAVSRFGLKAQEPDVATDEMMRWEHLPGLAELTLFADKDKIDYGQIVVTPLPERK